MARARNIKPGFFRNEDLVELPFETRLLFIGLWTIADREGRLEDRPKRIKLDLFPADSIDIEDCLHQLAEYGFILRYSVDGARYIQVVAFTKHQNPHKNEQPSTIPAPDEHRGSTVHAPESHGGTHADSLFSDSLIPHSHDSLIRDEDGADAPAPPVKPDPKGSRIPDDFAITNGDFDWALAEGMDGSQVWRETEKFIDYWRTIPGAKGRKLDWSLTWKNWIRRALEDRPRQNGLSVVGGDYRPKPAYYDRHGNYTAEGAAARARGEKI